MFGVSHCCGASVLPFGGGCLKAAKKLENFRKSFRNFKSSSVFFKSPNKGFTLSEKSGFCDSAYNNNKAIVSILYYTQKARAKVTENVSAEYDIITKKLGGFMRSFKNYHGTDGAGQSETGRGFMGNDSQTAGQNGYGQNGQGEAPSELSAAEDLTKRLAEAFHGQSSGVMLKKILEEAEEKKRAGELSNQEIDLFYEQFSPMLTMPQRTVLKSIIEKLKQI